MGKKGLEIEEILQAIKKRKKTIIFIVLSFVFLSGIYGFVMKKETHTASVKIFSGKTQEAQSYSTDELQDNTTLMDTYIELIKTDNFMNKVIKQTGINITADALKSSVGFSKTGNTPILTITYTNGDEKIAEKVVTVIASEFEKEVKETILNINTKVIEDVKVVTQYPNKIRYLILGFIGGVIVAIGIILILDCLDNSISNKNQLEKILPIPVIGELPLEKKLLKKE